MRPLNAFHCTLKASLTVLEGISIVERGGERDFKLAPLPSPPPFPPLSRVKGSGGSMLKIGEGGILNMPG